MALEVGELFVELDARTTEFNRALAQADRRMGRFEKDVTGKARRTSLSFGSIARSVGLVATAVTALGAALAAVGVAAFATGAVRAAAEYETLGVRLEVLTGNAEGAAKVLEDVNRLVTQTPFGLQELGNAAASVSVIFGENTAAISEFTAIGADLAAAFGRPVEQIGENLTRAFSSGLGAADAFREAGISAEILKITGETDVAKISTEELIEALRQLTEEGGKAFGAAEQLALTLNGALSNSTIAVENFQRAFGEALAPEVVEFALGVWIPLFQDLQSAVIANQNQIRAFAADVIQGIQTAFRAALRATIALVRGLRFLIDQWNALKVVLAGALVPLTAIVEALRLQLAVAQRTARGVVATARAVKLAFQRDFGGAQAAILEADAVWEGFSEEFARSADTVQASIDETSDALQNFLAGPETPILDGLEAGLDTVILKFDELTDSAARAKAEVAAPTVTARPRAEIVPGSVGKQEREAVEKDVKSFGQLLREETSQALAQGITSGNVLESITDVFGKQTEESLSKAFDEAIKFASDQLGGLFEGLNLGPGFGQALAGGLGAGLGLLQGALGGTRTTGTQAARSAVTSTQAVRGIVAGPTSIPIFEVGRGIGEAVAPLEEATREQTRILREILIAVRASGGVGLGMLDTEAATILETTSPSLA